VISILIALQELGLWKRKTRKWDARLRGHDGVFKAIFPFSVIPAKAGIPFGFFFVANSCGINCAPLKGVTHS
jgi:hypothetical protein